MDVNDFWVENLTSSQKRLLKHLDSFTVGGKAYTVEQDYYRDYYVVEVEDLENE